MPGTAVIGLQWGDEAKGKIVDLLTKQNDIVVRYQGGANAGHTIVSGDKKYKLSLIPSGIFHPNVQNVVANGVVIDPASLLHEINTLASQGVEIKNNLMISDRAHVIFPWHYLEDALLDKVGASEQIGTTMRGIGPCYQGKVSRSLAFRLGDLYRSAFESRVREVTEFKNRMFSGLLHGFDPARLEPLRKFLGTDMTFQAEAIIKEYADHAKKLQPFVADTTDYLLNAVDADRRILFEGAQGALLDIDHGTFPYVTSSNSSGTGISSGSGVPARFVSKVIGIIKAYTSRVGGGPFPTEQSNDIGSKLRNRGNEYGTVTKRPRRCGWFDAVAVRYTSRIAGATSLSMMLLDVLSTFEAINICTSYEIDGRKMDSFPASSDDLDRAIPLYETLPGWSEEISGVRNFGDLPVHAQNYVKRISEILQKPIEMVSVGPDREQMIHVQP